MSLEAPLNSPVNLQSSAQFLEWMEKIKKPTKSNGNFFFSVVVLGGRFETGFKRIVGSGSFWAVLGGLSLPDARQT